MRVEPKYYFIYYSCYISGKGIDDIYIPSITTMNQNIIDKHPIQWQLDCNEKYSLKGGRCSSKKYTVINWQELSVEEYKKFKDTTLG